MKGISMLNYEKIFCCLIVCSTAILFAENENQTRAGLCRPGALPCTCMQQNKFVQFATASHGAPVRTVSWCCQPVTNYAGHPAVHLAIAGDPVSGTLPGETDPSVILIRIYELDLVTQQFTEMNTYNINAQIQAAGEMQSELQALDWCCSDNAFFLIAGGNNLALYPNVATGPNIADVAVFAFDNASWQIATTTRIPFAVDKVGYYYYTYGNTVYAVSALCSPCTDSVIQFYLAIGGKTSTVGSRKQITIVTFILNS